MADLFSPFRLKQVTLRNRVAVAPMCQYSAESGRPTDWHLVHLGARAIGGAGLVIMEATAVAPEGRISPGCTGIWADDFIPDYARIARFVKSQGAVAGLQIAHAGRKASARRPWEGDAHLELDEGGWEIVGPSAVPFGGNLPRTPQALSWQGIQQIQQQFQAAARRADQAGFDWLELHFAHGYLVHSFLSPISNHRTDDYGGSAHHRRRLALETAAAVRQVWPEEKPLTVRLSVEDYLPGGLTLEDSITLAVGLKAVGVDLIDVSMGFNGPDISGIPWAPGFLAPLSQRLRAEAQIPTAVGWLITEPAQAQAIVNQGQADLIMLAREWLRDPQWVYHAARTLGQPDPEQWLPVPYARAKTRAYTRETS